MLGALLASVAVALWIGGPSPRTAAARLSPPRGGHVWVGRRPAVAAVITVLFSGAGVALVGVRAMVWVLIAGIVVGAAAWLRAGWIRRRRRSAAADQCATAARVLAALLRAGQLPATALAQAAAEFPVLRPAATAAELGADVGAHLAQAAQRPGCRGLAAVAAAWRLSERTGAPVADVLSGVAEELRRQRRVEAVVGAELAPARASGNIMATLPLVAVLLGGVAGVNTLDYLAHEPWGQALVLAGVVLAVSGVLWVDRLAARAAPGGATR